MLCEDFLKKNTPRRASAEHAEQVKLAANRLRNTLNYCE